MTNAVSGIHIATAAVTTAGVLGSVYYIYQVYKDTKVRQPTEWRHVGTLKKMYAYPIKSCGPVVLNQAECTYLGLKYGWLRDRILMVVNADQNFQTARANPNMLLVKPSINNSILKLQYDGMETCYVNLAEVASTQEVKMANVWGVPVPIYDCGYEPSEWFSRILNKSKQTYHLAYYASQDGRDLHSSNKMFKYRGTTDTGALPDETPFNLINEASIEDLNSRLKTLQVTERNFRPNFLLSGAAPYEEDNWNFIKIGENIFEVVKPCTRCVLTTIDPETGNRHSEVLEKLKSYRQVVDPIMRKSTGSSPRLGLQLALRSGQGGLVSVNDPIYVA